MTAVADVGIRIELGEAFADYLLSEHARRLPRRLGSAIGALARGVGLDRRVEVSLDCRPSRRIVTVVADGRMQPYAPDLLRRAWLAVAPEPLRDLVFADTAETPSGFAAPWLEEYLRSPNVEHALVSEFVEQLAMQVVVERPSCLLGPGRFKKLVPQDVPRTLLDMGVSLADVELIRRVVKEGTAIGRPPEDTLEALFTELRPHAVEILVHPDMLAELVTGDIHEPVSVYDARLDPVRQKPLRDIEEAFLSTFGFLLPKLVWVPTHAQAPHTMSVRIGTWRSLPVPTPPAGTRLVLTPPWDEALGEVPREASYHPVTGQMCTIVADELKDELEARGLDTRGAVDFAAVVLGSELSRRLPTLLGMEEVEYQLSRLSADPGRVVTDTSLIALTRFTLGDLTRVLRALVAEHLSIVDLGGLLERLVQYETVEFEYEIDEPIVLDDRLPVSRHALETVPPWQLHYSFLRRRLRSYLTYRHGGEEQRVYAHTLDPAIEDIARRSASTLRDDELNAIRDAVWRSFARSPADESHVVLTKTESRQPVRELLAPEFPDLPVLAIAELLPDVIEHVDSIQAPVRVPTP